MYQTSIKKSIERILKTPIGSRVMNPEFGSNLYKLIDKRPDDAWQMDCIRYIYEAIEKWEPRAKVDKVTLKKQGDKIFVKLIVTDKQKDTKQEIQITI